MLEELLKDPDKVSGVLYLIITVTAFVRGWVVPRWIFQKVEKDAEFFRQIALRSQELAERSVTAGTTILEKK